MQNIKNTNALAPIVSIGMPVYNGDKTLKSALDSLLKQSFTNFEIIISDNASTDGTKEICLSYAKNDMRIRYIRQEKNIGAINNFKFVLEQAVGKYFMWAAADDIRSSNNIEVNFHFLETHSDYAASCSPNEFDNPGNITPLVTFSLDNDDAFERYIKFFKNSFHSHGIFYSLIRTKVLGNSEILNTIFKGHDWLGFDWAVNLLIANKGKINRHAKGRIIFGVNGESSNRNIFKKYNNCVIEYFIPFYKLSCFLKILSHNLSNWQKIHLLYIMIKLNIYANLAPVKWRIESFLYSAYKIFIKPLVKT